MADAPAHTRPSPDPAASRAALLLRVLGALEVPLFSLVAAVYMWVASMGPAQLQQRVQDGQLAPQQAQAIAQAQPTAGRYAAVAVMIGVLPGAAYMAMSFGVRRRNRVATIGALLLTATQLIAFAAVVFERLLAALTGGSPAVLTVTVLLGGTLVALLAGTTYWLWRAGGPARDAGA